MFQNIIPKEVKGKYRNLKNYANYILLIIYLCGSWLVYERGMGSPNQALLIDLPDRKAYVFGIIILPNQMYILMSILIISALGLFLVTSVFGRVWCGFSCPHTVFVDLFRKVEHWIFGNHNRRIKLQDKSQRDKQKHKIYLMHFLWIIISFLFAFGWVCYFYGAKELVSDLLNLSVSKNGLLWLCGLTASTYFFAGFFREKMCTQACPYGRFQSAMVDHHTLQVHYNDWRGEPRGSVKSGATGDCIDCNQCVLVCPMGIDIRDGWQMECIGCGLCIDACDDVMHKLGSKTELIAFESTETIMAKQQNKIPTIKFFTSKNLIFASAILATVLLLSYSLINTKSLYYNVRYLSSRETTVLVDGSIRQNLKMELINQTDKPVDIKIRANIPNSEIKLGSDMEYVNAIIINLEPFEEYRSNFFVKYDENDLKNKNFSISMVDLSNKKEYKMDMKAIMNGGK